MSVRMPAINAGFAPLPLIFIGLIFVLAGPAVLHAQIDVMFNDDFENLNAGDDPALFLPSGSASPDWDNSLFNPELVVMAQNQIDCNPVGIGYVNSTKKYRLKSDGGNGKAVMLGANFSPSSDRFVVIEYDMLLTIAGINRPAAEIYYADGYSDLDGSDAMTKIALKVAFNKKNAATDEFYYTIGQANDLSGGIEYPFDPAISWAANTWYRIQVIADQEIKKFDIKVTDLSTGGTIEDQGLAFNHSGAGYIRKIWFGLESNATEMYLDTELGTKER